MVWLIYTLTSFTIFMNVALAANPDKSQGLLVLASDGIPFSSIKELQQRKDKPRLGKSPVKTAFVISFGNTMDTVELFDGQNENNLKFLGKGNIESILFKNIHEQEVKYLTRMTGDRIRLVTSKHLASAVSIENKVTFFAAENFNLKPIEVKTHGWSFFSYLYEPRLDEYDNHIISFGTDSEPLLGKGYSVYLQTALLPLKGKPATRFSLLSATTFLSESDLENLPRRPALEPVVFPTLEIKFNKASGEVTPLHAHQNGEEGFLPPTEFEPTDLPNHLKFIQGDLKSLKVTLKKINEDAIFSLPIDLYSQFSKLPRDHFALDRLVEKLGDGLWIHSEAAADLYVFVAAKDLKPLHISKVGGTVELSHTPWAQNQHVVSTIRPLAEPFTVEVESLQVLAKTQITSCEGVMVPH